MSRTQAGRASLTGLVLQSSAIMESEFAKVLKDAFPKAQCHFLIIPKEDIVDVYALTRDHIPLLDHMKDLANQIIEQQNLPSRNFLIGFKLDALMGRLTMHVISDDFYSKSMKRFQHWNSFHTDLFLTYQALYALLRINGLVEPLSVETANELRSTKPLHCNQCTFKSFNFPLFKMHLLEHWKAREKQVEIKKEVDKVISMLADSKLEVVPTEELPKTLKEQSINLPQKSNQQENHNTKHIKPIEQKKSCSQGKGLQPTDSQMPGSYNNVFAKHLQMQHNRQVLNIQTQPIQYIIDHRPWQHFNHLQPLQTYDQRAVNMPNIYQYGGIRPQQFFMRMPNWQQQQNPRFSIANVMQLSNIQQQQQGNPQPIRPHFNPFRQTPNVVQVGPNQNNNFPQQQNQNQNPSTSRPTLENKQIKPNWKPKPTNEKPNHAQIMSNTGPEKTSKTNHENPSSNLKISKNVCQINDSDSASSKKGKAQTDVGKPYKKKFAPKQKKNNQNVKK